MEDEYMRKKLESLTLKKTKAQLAKMSAIAEEEKTGLKAFKYIALMEAKEKDLRGAYNKATKDLSDAANMVAKVKQLTHGTNHDQSKRYGTCGSRLPPTFSKGIYFQKKEFSTARTTVPKTCRALSTKSNAKSSNRPDYSVSQHSASRRGSIAGSKRTPQEVSQI